MIKTNTVFLLFLLLSIQAFPQNSGEEEDSVLYDGQWYHTVRIGGQFWLKENLNVGEMIPVNNTQENNGITEKYCYDNNPENCEKYGGLYQWYEALQYVPGGSNVRGICPVGWHIPTLDEFHVLKDYIHNDGNAFKKEAEGWGRGTATNTSGFSALLSGYFYNTFMFMDTLTIFWTATVYTPIRSYDICPTGYNAMIYDGHSFNTDGFSVRCIKNESLVNEDKMINGIYYTR